MSEKTAMLSEKKAKRRAVGLEFVHPHALDGVLLGVKGFYRD